MAITNFTEDRQKSIGQSSLLAFVVTFDGDDSYPTGGTVGFQAFLRDAAQLDREITILAVVPGDCQGFIPAWTGIAGDALKVYESGADGTALDEVTNATDLSTSSFTLTILAT